MRKEEFLALYGCCFPEDSQEDANRMWALSCSGKVLCRVCDGRPAAMLTLLPAKLSGALPLGLYYIFAACTHPDYRRRGLMETLLQDAYDSALKDGMQGVFLRPANDSLTKYYMNRGFTVLSRYRIEQLAGFAPSATGTQLNFSSFSRLRDKLLPPHSIAWQAPFLEANCQYIKAFGDEDNLLVYETLGTTLCVRELFGKSAGALAAAVAAKQGCKRILCRQYGSGEPYTLARTIHPLPEIYVGLTLDEFD